MVIKDNSTKYCFRSVGEFIICQQVCLDVLAVVSVSGRVQWERRLRLRDDFAQITRAVLFVS
jgi:hypothetical protein